MNTTQHHPLLYKISLRNTKYFPTQNLRYPKFRNITLMLVEFQKNLNCQIFQLKSKLK